FFLGFFSPPASSHSGPANGGNFEIFSSHSRRNSSKAFTYPRSRSPRNDGSCSRSRRSLNRVVTVPFCTAQCKSWRSRFKTPQLVVRRRVRFGPFSQEVRTS